MPMKQNYTIYNDFSSLFNEIFSTMVKSKLNQKAIEKPDLRNNYSKEPGKKVLNFIISYSKSLEVIKDNNTKPIMFIRN